MSPHTFLHLVYFPENNHPLASVRSLQVDVASLWAEDTVPVSSTADTVPEQMC
jgi:hypothetical protein